jgi:hypothetical protein
LGSFAKKEKRRRRVPLSGIRKVSDEMADLRLPCVCF